MHAARICVVGSLNMDLVVRTPHLPQPGETVTGGPFGTYLGGKGANQAVAAARMGGTVTLVGRIGEDAFGTQLRTGLEHEGIVLDHVAAVPGTASGVALIEVDAGGENTIIVAPGANSTLTPADVEAAEAAITTADVVLLQLEIPLPAVQRTAELARAAGTITLLNPAPAQPLPAALLQLIDYLIPNETEAAILLEQAHTSDDAAYEAQQLRDTTGVRNVVMTLGAQGALLAAANGTLHSLAPHSMSAVDTTAAGDAFVGAFAVALATGEPPTEALRWGNAAGALAVTRAGAQPSLPTHEEVSALLQS